MIKNMDVSLHYASQQASGFDPWSVTGAVRCPVLVLTGEDDPICPLPVVEELVSRLPRRPPAWCVFPVLATPSSATAQTSHSRP